MFLIVLHSRVICTFEERSIWQTTMWTCPLSTRSAMPVSRAIELSEHCSPSERRSGGRRSYCLSCRAEIKLGNGSSAMCLISVTCPLRAIWWMLGGTIAGWLEICMLERLPGFSELHLQDARSKSPLPVAHCRCSNSLNELLKMVPAIASLITIFFAAEFRHLRSPLFERKCDASHFFTFISCGRFRSGSAVIHRCSGPIIQTLTSCERGGTLMSHSFSVN